MAGEHRRELEAKIEDAHNGVARLEKQIEGKQKAFARVVSADDPDDDAADVLQRERDALKREKERLQLRVDTLERQLPEATVVDMKDRFEEILPQLEQCGSESIDDMKRLEQAHDAYEAAAHVVCRRSIESYDMRNEAGRLLAGIYDATNRRGVMRPPLPQVAVPDDAFERRIIDAHDSILNLIGRARKMAR